MMINILELSENNDDSNIRLPDFLFPSRRFFFLCKYDELRADAIDDQISSSCDMCLKSESFNGSSQCSQVEFLCIWVNCQESGIQRRFIRDGKYGASPRSSSG